MSNKNRYYVAVSANLVKKNVSSEIGSVYACHVESIDTKEILTCSLNKRFRNMTVSAYEASLER